MSAMASQITGVSIVYSTVCSGADQRKHQSSASLAFVEGIPRWSMDSQHNGPVTRKMFSFNDIIMCTVAVKFDRYLNSTAADSEASVMSDTICRSRGF